jgi:hypothetical protein
MPLLEVYIHPAKGSLTRRKTDFVLKLHTERSAIYEEL